jgi:hypothetical protein
MRYQSTPYNCGPAALQNALKALRRHVTQTRIAELAGTTEAEGTDEHGLIRASIALDCGVDEISCREPSVAFARVYGALLVGRPVLLCVDRWSHWVTAAGVIGTSVLVVEPGGYQYATKENGVLVLSKDNLLRRWRAARRTRGKSGPAYYGIAIGATDV